MLPPALPPSHPPAPPAAPYRDPALAISISSVLGLGLVASIFFSLRRKRAGRDICCSLSGGIGLVGAAAAADAAAADESEYTDAGVIADGLASDKDSLPAPPSRISAWWRRGGRGGARLLGGDGSPAGSSGGGGRNGGGGGGNGSGHRVSFAASEKLSRVKIEPAGVEMREARSSKAALGIYGNGGGGSGGSGRCVSERLGGGSQMTTSEKVSSLDGISIDGSLSEPSEVDAQRSSCGSVACVSGSAGSTSAVPSRPAASSSSTSVPWWHGLTSAWTARTAAWTKESDARRAKREAAADKAKTAKAKKRAHAALNLACMRADLIDAPGPEEVEALEGAIAAAEAAKVDDLLLSAARRRLRGVEERAEAAKRMAAKSELSTSIRAIENAHKVKGATDHGALALLLYVYDKVPSHPRRSNPRGSYTPLPQQALLLLM